MSSRHVLLLQFLLILLLVVSSGSTSSSSDDYYNPVIFAPGYGGSDMYATIESQEYVPTECVSLSLPIGRPFLAMPSGKGIVTNSACLKALFTVPGPPGVQIGVADFGGYKGISSPYWTVHKTFSSWGYELGKDFFGAPYDYRYMTKKGISSDGNGGGGMSQSSSGFASALQHLVEEAYLLNNNTRVVLMGHSNGPPTLYSFLLSMTSEWRSKYVQALLTLSGNLLGQMNGYSGLLYSSNKDVQDMEATWDATYLSCSWGAYAGLVGVPLVTTYYQTAQERNYTTSLDDVTALFDSVGKQQWSEALVKYFPEMDRTIEPGVDVFCLYGSNIATSYSFAFAGTINEAPPVLVRNMEGDNNQDITDNAFCETWRTASTDNQLRFESQAFPGVTHMGMVSDEGVMNKVHEVLMSYLQ